MSTTNKRSGVELFGDPSSLESLATTLDEHADAIDADPLHVFRMAALHMRGAALRLHRRSNAHDRADAAMNSALASMHVSALGQDHLDPNGCYVYCLWGVSDLEPLYVGMSTNVLGRLGQHYSNRARRPFIKRITLTRCRNYSQMRKMELRLIRHYRPEWNVAGLGAGER